MCKWSCARIVVGRTERWRFYHENHDYVYHADIYVVIVSTGVFAETLEDRVRTLEETLKKQEQTIQELRGSSGNIEETGSNYR